MLLPVYCPCCLERCSIVWLACVRIYAKAAETITGPAPIINGYTIDVGGRRVRIHGIDAPEGKQLCWMPKGAPGKPASALRRQPAP